MQLHKLHKHALELEQSGGRRGQRQPEVGREGEGRLYHDNSIILIEWEQNSQSIHLQCMSWYDLPSFLSCLFPPLSVPCPISVTFQLHLTSSTCLPLPPLQLQGVLMQLCYIHAQTSLGLTSDLLGPDSHTKGYHLYTSYNLSDPFFIINNR